MPEETLPGFTGKVVTFYVANGPPKIDAGIAMEYLESKRLGGRLFVVGRVPEMSDSQWVSRLQRAIAWDAVVHYLVFDSQEEFRTRLATAKPWILEFIPRGAG